MNYTWASNLYKDHSMQVGAVSYKNNSLVKRFKIEKDKSIVNRITKTKEEKYPDLRDELETFKCKIAKEQADMKKKVQAEKDEEEKKEQMVYKKKREEYSDFMAMQDFLKESNQN